MTRWDPLARYQDIHVKKWRRSILVSQTVYESHVSSGRARLGYKNPLNAVPETSEAPRHRAIAGQVPGLPARALRGACEPTLALPSGDRHRVHRVVRISILHRIRASISQGLTPADPPVLGAPLAARNTHTTETVSSPPEQRELTSDSRKGSHGRRSTLVRTRRERQFLDRRSACWNGRRRSLCPPQGDGRSPSTHGAAYGGKAISGDSHEEYAVEPPFDCNWKISRSPRQHLLDLTAPPPCVIINSLW